MKKILVISLIVAAAGYAALMGFILLFGDGGDEGGRGGIDSNIAGKAKISQDVERYRPLFEKYAEKYDLTKHIDVIMALVMQESGGRHLDVMQSSESMGLPPNTITDPEVSIDVGMKHFKSVLDKAGGDIKLTLQAYNYGGGFIDYVKKNGGKYSKELALSFSKEQAAKVGWSSYGDPLYVDHVLRYLDTGGKGGGKNQKFDYAQVHNIMKEYLGTPYVWGGRSPSAGGFDCSGLMEYAFGQIGVDLNGNAATQYEKTKPVPDDEAEPGDLVFFSTYAPGPTHVGMYVGDGKFINSNDAGLEYSSVETWKKLYPYLGFRRI
ncbi:lysozyme family protein [Bacillus velezensis]|nr:bifunctional lytic transglycosylase/C40 family peptidase [Bacillus velezensis]AVB12192.1 endopeptidase [Bacillus velezensis]MEC1905496.1 bifunctional lytic transglycosylase/C40 family peptidase [Bacillus velezensis]